jgi:protein Mpv17
VPINFYWQRALEARYPGFPSRAEISNLLRSWRSLFSLSALRAFFFSAISSEASPRLGGDAALPRHREKEEEKEKEAEGRWVPRAQRSGLHSFVMKFLFDQTVAGAMNIVLFVVLINFLKGESLGKVWELVLVVCLPPSFLFPDNLCIVFIYCDEICGAVLIDLSRISVPL